MISVVFVTLEAFEALNIEYCHNVDFAMFYWCFWSLAQVGSVLAMCVVMLKFWISLADVEMPWWTFALRTPLLVLAAVKGAWDRMVGKLLRSQAEEGCGERREPPRVMIEIGKG
jgi:hypothetical protein